MKKCYSIIFAFLFIQLCAQAQFNVCPTGTYTMGVVYTYAVNEQIYWASRRDVTGTIVTTDGGNTWTLGSFVDPKVYPVFCIHAFNADTAFVVASTFYKTTDRGATWNSVTGVFNNASSFANTIHFFDQNNGVAMGDPVDGYFEIYTTTDGGVNWVRVPSNNIPAPLTGEAGYTNTHAYYNNSYWFSTSNARIFRSTDRGYTWTSYQFPQATGALSIAFRDELHGISDPFNGSYWDYYSTSDGGSTWTYVSSKPSWMYGYASIAYIPGTQSTYTVNSISYSGNELKAMVLFTNDDGLTWHRMDDWGAYSSGDWLDFPQWTSVNSGWGSFYGANYGNIYHWTGYTGKHIWRAGSSINFGNQEVGEIGDTFGISIGNYGTLPTTISSLNLSSTNFSLVNSPTLPIVLQSWDAVDISIAGTPQARGLFNDSLVILSDAENYGSISVTLAGKGLEFTPLLPDLIYASSDSLFTLSLSNLTASQVGGFEGIKIEGLTIRPADSVLIGISTTGVSSTLYRIDPIIGGCLPIVTIPVGNIRSIAYTNTGTLFAGSNTGELYHINTNTGLATPIGTTSGKKYSAFAINPLDGKLYASVLLTFGSPKDGIYLIDTLTGAATLLGLTGDGKPTISIAYNDDGTLYGLKGRLAETNKLITISTTDGVGTEIGTLGKTGLQAIIMSNIMIIPVELTSFNASSIGKDVQLFWSTATELNNYGFEIQRKALGGAFATVTFIKGQGTSTQKNEYSYTDKNLDGGTYSYRLKQVDLDGKFEYSKIVEVEVISIISYSLSQNYPNPFNPSTTINYGLKEKSNVKLILLNSLGEETSVLVNEEHDKGYHKVEFDGSKLSSGVYFYQIKAGEYTAVKKMLLLK